MKFNYKNTEITVEDEKILIKTNNLELAKKLKEHNFEVESEWSLKEFLELNNVTLIDRKKEVLYRGIKVLAKVKEVEEYSKGFKYVLESPGKRSCFTASLKIKFEPETMLLLEGVLQPDDYTNSKNRSKLEKIINFEYMKFDAMKVKKVELVEEKQTYSKPRYELHLHTIHSKRDAHITHEELEKAFKEGKLGALAITNHGINNCFPDSVKTFGKSEFKVIPAVEIYLVDDLKLDEEIKRWELENSNNFILKEKAEQEVAEIESQLESIKKIIEQKAYEKGGLKPLNERKKELNADLKEQKNEIKALEKEIKELEKTKPNLGDAKRYHATILLKTKNSIYKDDKYEFEYNEGVVELNRMITRANTLGLAEPIQFKWLGKRPTVALSDLKAKRKHFIIGSACSMGTITDALIEGNETLAEEYIDLYDYLEIQPLHNNSYLMREEEWKERYPTKEELKALNHKIYDFAKKHNKKVCFTSDAHVINKESRYKRAVFKKSYISMLMSRNGEDTTKALLDNQENTQPWLHSYEEMVAELTEQGFSEEQIEELYQNEKEISEQCSYFNNTKVFPDLMFIPDFPGVDVKEELPKLAFKRLKEMYGPEPDELIVKRMTEELNALASKSYEFIYYVSSLLVSESRARMFDVGSRGSVGSSVLAMFAGITTNNALPPHYHCPNCHHHEWTGNLKKDYVINDEIVTKTLKIGLDFDDKNCPTCGTKMWSDGFSGDFRSFVGAELDKIPDIDLNFAGEVQSEIQDLLIEWMDGKAFGSATMKYIKSDYFKQNILSKFPDIERRIKEEKDDENNTFDFDFLARNCSGGLDSISKHAGS